MSSDSHHSSHFQAAVSSRILQPLPSPPHYGKSVTFSFKVNIFLCLRRQSKFQNPIQLFPGGARCNLIKSLETSGVKLHNRSNINQASAKPNPALCTVCTQTSADYATKDNISRTIGWNFLHKIRIAPNSMASVKIPEQKVILCGEFGVGKSSLFRRFMNDTFTTATDRKSTMGLDHYGKVYNIKGKDLKLQLWDTGGMERVASITSSYYKYSEAAILVFSLDNPDTFHILSQHLLDIVTYAENAKIFLCGNKYDQKSRIQITDSDMEAFCEQCHNLVSGVYKTSCKTGEGVEEMFKDIASQLAMTNRSRMELQAIEETSFQVVPPSQTNPAGGSENSCSC